jgi:hypothetical protein
VVMCVLSKTNGKNGKNGKRCVKWLILKGLVFSVFYSVFYSVLVVKTESCLRRLSCRVRHRNKLVGVPVGVRACFSFFPSLSLQLSVLPYTVGCKVRHEGKLVGVCVRVCGHTSPHSPLSQLLLSYPTGGFVR